ncbi:MAG: type II secretion system protein [Kiritimatiellae bacterium]|nr:type II secretion system protein [Kiritimatiellia bacterium]
MKKAFTLIELLIVVGILAVLIGILIVSIGGGTESARAAKCLTNMKNLATACNNCAMVTGWYPAAGSFERRALDTKSTTEIKFYYSEVPGWISWDSRNAYDSKPTSHIASGGWITSTYNQDFDTRQYALTNGALWKYISANSTIYRCPSHIREFSKKQPLWSYVMNSRFGWDTSMGSRAVGGGIEYGKLARADRTLMFSELQFTKNDMVTVDSDEGPGIHHDCTLQYGKGEVIGFNHPSGKRTMFAHVAFADGHVEKLTIPAKYSSTGWLVEVSDGDLKNLTEWLCQGRDVSFNGSRYEKLEN